MEELLDNYKQIFSFKDNYLRYMKKLYYVIQTIVIGIILILVLLFGQNKGMSIGVGVLIGYICILIFLGNTARYALKECKRINKDIHKLKKNCSFYELKKEEFTKYLLQRGIDIHNKCQMEYLINLLEDNINRIRPKEYIKNGVLIGIILPVWNWYINCMYNKFITTEQQALNFLLAILFCVGLIAFVGYLVIKALKSIYFSLIYSDYSKLKEMKALVEDIFLYAINEKSKTLSPICILQEKR